MRRFASILAFTLAFLGCSSSVESTSGSGGFNTGGTTTMTSNNLGGSGGSSSTSSEGGSGGVCDPAQPKPCGPEDPFAYPDDSLTYAPDAQFVTVFQPLPGEFPKGAAAGALGPFAEERQVIAVEIVAGGNGNAFCKLPDPVRYAVWTEDHCGLPTAIPYNLSQEITLAEVEQQDINAEAVRLTIPLVDAPVTVPVGSTLYVALILTAKDTCAAVFEPINNATRALWYGRSDLNCDGETDANLGWAFLTAPTDPSVNPYNFNLGFGAQF